MNNYIINRFKNFIINIILKNIFIFLILFLPLLSPLFLILFITLIIISFIFILYNDCMKFSRWKYYDIWILSIPVFYKWERDVSELKLDNNNNINNLKKNIIIINPDNTINYGVQY